jgi:pilus assembly protein FimV
MPQGERSCGNCALLTVGSPGNGAVALGGGGAGLGTGGGAALGVLVGGEAGDAADGAAGTAGAAGAAGAAVAAGFDAAGATADAGLL